MVDQRFSVSVHIMTSLAYHQGQGHGLMTSDQLASGIRTNPTVVRRLVSRLADAGLVQAYKGKSGGVELSKKPAEITLREIYCAVSDKKLLNVPDKAPQKKCPVSCSMGKLMSDVIEGFEEHSLAYLSGIRLSELTDKISE